MIRKHSLVIAALLAFSAGSGAALAQGPRGRQGTCPNPGQNCPRNGSGTCVRAGRGYGVTAAQRGPAAVNKGTARRGGMVNCPRL